MPEINADPNAPIMATDIRIARGEVHITERVEQDQNGRVIGRRKGHKANDSFRRYWKRREITDLQYKAGLALVECASLMEISVPSQLGAKTGRVGYADVGMVNRGNVAYMARVRWGLAMQAVGLTVAPLLAWVVIENKPAGQWAAAHGKPKDAALPILQLALDALIKHWGLTSSPTST